MSVPRPPLADLRAFEAAARHLSFTKAAAELGVTQGAISQRIRKLEELLDLQLFERRTRALVLTNAGQTLATAVADGLSRIALGLEEIGRPPAPRSPKRLTVSVLPDFASKWLLPRLTGFQDKYPEVEVQITAEDRFADFVTDGVDLGIRFGCGENPGLTTLLLMPDVVFPVCSPDLLKEGGSFTTPAELLNCELLHDAAAEHNGSGCDWRHWFEQAGIASGRLEGLRVSPSKLVIESAADGLGIALARAALIGDDLAEGRLVRPLRQSATTVYSYFLVHRPAVKLDCHVAAFIDWVRAEAAEWLLTKGQMAGMPVRQASASLPEPANQPVSVSKRAS
jgi:LysR family glycine cleavage system transcriptional activator